MTDNTELLPVTQGGRELYKFILDAPFATCSRIDNLPDDAPELQAIARHRKWAIGPVDEDDLETVIADSIDLDWLPRDGARAVMAALYENGIAPSGEYICKCGLRVEPHRCRDTKGEF